MSLFAIPEGRETRLLANVEDGYLGVVGGSGYPAGDGADHYSVAGFLEYARQGQ